MTEILELDPSLVERITDDVLDGKHLPQDDARLMLHMLASPNIPDAAKGAMLGAMRVKGATPDEVRGLAMAMQDIATPIPGDPLPDLVDTCGTGGDGSQSVNISTATALLAAACGLTVAKHGNVSVSSRSGSADVLRALGVPLPMNGADARAQLDHTGFAFLFAPAFHPATKGVGKVRRDIGRRTVFNVLGPLTNPARPRYQLVGAYAPNVARLMAHALRGMDAERAFVVHGAPGWDEATPVGPFLRYDVRGDSVVEATIDPADVGIARCTPDDLRGDTPEHNAARLRAVLTGDEHGAHRDAVLLNTGLILEVSGRAEDLADGIEQARAVLDAGRGTAVLDRLCAGADA